MKGHIGSGSRIAFTPPKPCARALGLLEHVDVDLDAEHLLQATHVAAAGALVLVGVEERAVHLDAAARLDRLVAERAALAALGRLLWSWPERPWRQVYPRSQPLAQRMSRAAGRRQATSASGPEQVVQLGAQAARHADAVAGPEAQAARARAGLHLEQYLGLAGEVLEQRTSARRSGSRRSCARRP